IHTLNHELLIEMLIVSLVILIFLWHIPSAMIPIFTLPAAVILAFIPMRLFGINANIMSLGGIAVAIGALVDAAVVVVENAHKKLEAWESAGRQGDYKEVLITAIQEVGRPSFYSLLVIALALLVVLATVPIYFRLGREFMPPLNEGVILYMPTTLPGISVTEASALLQKQDELLRQVPEVERVFGKAGRADTSTDPAPLSMMETTVILKPESQWRRKERWYTKWMPSFLMPLVRPL